MNRDEKEFVDIFRQLSTRHSPWEVWRDFVFMSAASISNQIDKRPGVWHDRENRYLSAIKRYDERERRDIPKLLAVTANSLSKNSAQDFLGKLFMELELSNHWKGQFFTPYDVADMMARVTAGSDAKLKGKVHVNGYISAHDPACGSGVMLIAIANRCRELGIDPSREALLVGQDIDETAALMCYIQLSLLNCAGFVVVGDSLTEPMGGSAPNRRNLWVTPAYFLGNWNERQRRNHEH